MGKLRDEMLLNVQEIAKGKFELRGAVVVNFAAIGNDLPSLGETVEGAIRKKLTAMLFDTVEMPEGLKKNIEAQKKKMEEKLKDERKTDKA